MVEEVSGSQERKEAVEVFADFLDRIDRGESRSIDELCAAHARLGGELRRLHANWGAVAPLFRPHELASVAERLRASLGDEVDPAVDLRDTERAGEVPPSILERLAARTGDPRYGGVEDAPEIGRGGMGAVLRVWDADVRRALAMKVLLGSEGVGSKSSALDPLRVRRFLEEVQITGQLDHPGVVPVHELGLDAQGRVFFTMRLVRGRELGEIFELARREVEGWSRTRALSVVLKICETMAFAHAKGVIHRDLKPSNVMVGGFGETYVMDWGLAKVVDAADGTSDPRDLASLEPVATDGSESDGPLLTRDGAVMGTPAYMPPEQARGDAEAMGPRSDVYSVGALLYHLLAGHPPFLAAGERGSASAVLLRVLEGAPEPLERAASGIPAELVAVSEKAMARSPERRYADMGEMAEDLRAYLEGRVVRAHATGALAELRKWVARNRGTALASAAAVIAAVVGLASTTWVQARSNRTLAERNEELRVAHGEASRSEALANARFNEAEAERVKVLRLSDLTRLDDLRERAEDMYPTLPDRIPKLRAWVDEAKALVARLEVHQADLLDLRGRAPPVAEARRLREHPNGSALRDALVRLEEHRALLLEVDDGQRRSVEASILGLEERVARLEAEIAAWRPWVFPTQELQWQHDQLERLVAGTEIFAAERTGLLSEVERRLAFAGTVEERTVAGAHARESWGAAIASIADQRLCPAYRGLEIEPQIGLVPIGRDARSGLWRFALLESGDLPVVASDGELVLDDASALVLVLVPGGRFTMGAVRGSGAPNRDPFILGNEQPLVEVQLDAFFLSAFEMTQAQWIRATGENPSVLHPEHVAEFHERYSLVHPVENVSWHEAQRVLARLGLALPTEAQWEYAARAATTTVFWTGDTRESLAGAANLFDTRAGWTNAPDVVVEMWLDDGWVGTAPVGSFAPNAFGLFDVAGNVWEWCLDWTCSYESVPRPGTGERLGGNPNFRILRGGSFNELAVNARSAMRFHLDPRRGSLDVGLRPARALR